MARRAERAILDICEREATPPAGMPRAESRYRNSRYGPLAKLRLKPPSQTGLHRAVGPGADTSVLVKEEHRLTSRKGGSDDAQHRRYYPPPRLPVGPLHRPALSARLHAEAPDLRRAVLFPGHPPRSADSLAGALQASAR